MLPFFRAGNQGSGIAEIRRLKAGRGCAGIRGKRLAIVCTARIGDSEFVEEDLFLLFCQTGVANSDLGSR